MSVCMFDEISFPNGFGLRLASGSDQPFMEDLFRSAREYFYLMPLSKQQVELLLKQQFVLQQSSYRTNFPHAVTFVIEFNGADVGKIMLNKTAGVVHLIDIILASKIRSKGYGSQILCAIKAFAEKKNYQVKLSVDQQNRRARKLYLALGFCVIASSDTHDTLIWSP